jgi:hypothetical protein
MNPPAKKNPPPVLLFLFTLAVAAISALPYAGSWNDGSRLAAVESLVDHRTWQIDDSIFVKTPGRKNPPDSRAYPADDQLLAQYGTQDKLYIRGHYYSDKSPLPALAMAGVYKALQLATGLTAAKNPALFCYLMTLIFSGGSYIISVLCIDRLAAKCGLEKSSRWLVTASFALASVALPYAREVNNHILLLAVFSLIFLAMFEFVENGGEKKFALLLSLIGTLIGIGYTIDLGTGPVLVLCTAGFLFCRTRSVKTLAVMLLCAFPWFLAHHWFNYMLGGTFKPANSVPEYFLWPGSPFNAQNLTGGWAHKNVWHFLFYAVDMMAGKKGFLGCNLPLYLAIVGAIVLLRKKVREAALLPFSIALILGTWLLYAATSNNYSGLACSVRWFVPLLAPFYCILIALLKKFPQYETDMLILTAWALPMGALMWLRGPWMKHMVPGYWFFVAAALASWIGWRYKNRAAAQ